MNFLRLISLPAVFLSLSGALTGFFLAVFSGTGIDKTTYLPHVILASIFLAMGNSAWNTIFCAGDDTDKSLKIVIPKVSMSMSFTIATTLYLIALMVSMTVSLLSFYTVSGFILLSFLLNAIFKPIPVIEAIFFSLNYVLLIVLGLSAHAYIIYLMIEPVIYIPIAGLFLYILVLRIIRNVSVKEVTAGEEEIPDQDQERESLELSTEIDSVYPGHVNHELTNDYDLACKLSDKMIKRNLSLILPDKHEHGGVVKNIKIPKKPILATLWLTCFAIAVLLMIPAALVLMNLINPLQLAVLGLIIVFLLFPLFRIILKREVDAVYNFYKDGIISISLFNAIIISSTVINPFSQAVLTLLGILVGMLLPLIILKKHFSKFL